MQRSDDATVHLHVHGARRVRVQEEGVTAGPAHEVDDGAGDGVVGGVAGAEEREVVGVHDPGWNAGSDLAFPISRFSGVDHAVHVDERAGDVGADDDDGAAGVRGDPALGDRLGQLRGPDVGVHVEEVHEIVVVRADEEGACATVVRRGRGAVRELDDQRGDDVGRASPGDGDDTVDGSREHPPCYPGPAPASADGSPSA